MKKRLLLNYLYYRPVGHVVEALKVAKALYDANKNIEIHVLLNSRSPIELTKACPWIKKSYPIDQRQVLNKGIKASCYKEIPKTWDYIITNNQAIIEWQGKKNLGWEEEAFLKHFEISNRIFSAKKEKGILWPRKLPKPLKYKSERKVVLKLPQKAIKFAKKYLHKGEKICIMLGGSAGYPYYPAVSSWIKIIKEIKNKFPNSKIYLTGVKKSLKGRTNTLGYTPKQINSILKQADNVVDCYDIGMWNQLALIRQCGVFISPHTGFAFLALCVETPWIEIAGGNWNMYIFNNIPFYSVLPDDKYYPYHGSLDTENYKGKILGMKPKNLQKKIPEIMEAIKFMLDPKTTYKKALKTYINNIKRSQTKKERMNLPPFDAF